MGRDWEFGEIKGGRRQRRKERVKETRQVGDNVWYRKGKI